MLDHWGFDIFMLSSTSLDILKIVMIENNQLSLLLDDLPIPLCTMQVSPHGTGSIVK